MLKLDFLREDSEMKKAIFSKFDNQMQVEQKNSTDKEI